MGRYLYGGCARCASVSLVALCWHLPSWFVCLFPLGPKPALLFSNCAGTASAGIIDSGVARASTGPRLYHAWSAQARDRGSSTRARGIEYIPSDCPPRACPYICFSPWFYNCPKPVPSLPPSSPALPRPLTRNRPHQLPVMIAFPCAAPQKPAAGYAALCARYAQMVSANLCQSRGAAGTTALKHPPLPYYCARMAERPVLARARNHSTCPVRAPGIQETRQEPPPMLPDPPSKMFHPSMSFMRVHADAACGQHASVKYVGGGAGVGGVICLYNTVHNLQLSSAARDMQGLGQQEPLNNEDTFAETLVWYTLVRITLADQGPPCIISFTRAGLG